MIHEEYITTSNVCTINDRASRYMTNIDRAKRVNKFTVVIGIVDETHSTNRKNVRMAINLNKKNKPKDSFNTFRPFHSTRSRRKIFFKHWWNIFQNRQSPRL